MGRLSRESPLSDCNSGTGRPHWSPYSRDIFPLPLPRTVPKVKVLSRRSVQRVARKAHNCMRSREAVMALNWMWGAKCPRIQILTLDPLQREVLERVTYFSKLCQDVGSLSRVPEPEAALKELLRGRSEYGSEPPTTLATCSIERISLLSPSMARPAVVTSLMRRRSVPAVSGANVESRVRPR